MTVQVPESLGLLRACCATTTPSRSSQSGREMTSGLRFHFRPSSLRTLLVLAGLVLLCGSVRPTSALECYECVGKSCQEGFGKARVCADKIDTCVTIFANETRTSENVLARNCSLPWMKWEGECNLVQPSGSNSPRAKLKGYMCLCRGDLCNGSERRAMGNASLAITGSAVLLALLFGNDFFLGTSDHEENEDAETSSSDSATAVHHEHDVDDGSGTDAGRGRRLRLRTDPAPGEG